METLNVILVPTDFTPVAECAIHHACLLAQKGHHEVRLLHILNKESKAELKKKGDTVETLQRLLQSQCTYYSEKYKVGVEYSIKEGTIFTHIGKEAEEVKAALIVMGTHGVVGMQKIMGAFAIKVIESSNVPVIVVQHKMPELNGYTRILFPIDFTPETKQKTMQTISMAKTFDATVLLYKQAGIDEVFKNQIELNAQFVKRYLKEHQIPIEEGIQQQANADFEKDFVAYGKQMNANLIIILTTKDKELKDFVLGPVEQKVINNHEEIPVMCVHPLQNMYKTERLASLVNLSF